MIVTFAGQLPASTERHFAERRSATARPVLAGHPQAEEFRA